MIIRRIRMVNFRGFRDKTIDFNDKSVVLLRLQMELARRQLWMRLSGV